MFSGVDTGEEAKGTWEDGQQKQNRELRTLEAVCVQHEIDHLNGMRILDRAQELTIRRTERKIGRNEKCPCGSGKKYKKCCIGK